MATDQPPPSGPPGNRGRRRPGPTIDLEATEIASVPATPQQAGDPTPPEEPAVKQAMPEPETPKAASEPPQPEAAPRKEAAAPDEAAAASRWAFPGRMSIAWLPPHLPWPLLGAAAAGAVLVGVLVVVAGQFTGRDNGTAAFEDRLARVERQLRDLARRPPPLAIDLKIVEDLVSRVAKLEAAAPGARPPALDPAALNRISTVEGQLKALEEKIGVVARRTDDIDTVARDARQRAETNAAALAELARRVAALAPTAAERGEATALANRIAALERSTKTLEGELAKRGGGANDPAVRLAVSAAALNAAVERGDPFAPELAAVKSLAADPAALAKLEPLAPNGVPTASALGRELQGLLPVIAQIAGATPREGGILERLAANAARLVRIRPLGDVAGDDPAAVLARLEHKAAQPDIAGALDELGKLPAAARAPAQAWMAKAQARVAAHSVSRRLAADAFAALGTSP